MTAEGLAAFAMIVAGDAELRRELLVTDGREEFAALVVRRAHAAGCDVGPGEVEEGLRARRRAWQERWV